LSLASKTENSIGIVSRRLSKISFDMDPIILSPQKRIYLGFIKLFNPKIKKYYIR